MSPVATYTVIWPLTLNGVSYPSGATLILDGATANSLLALKNPPISPTTDPATAAKLAAALHASTAAISVPAESDQDEDPTVTTSGNPTLSDHPLAGRDGDDAARYH